MKVEFFKHNIGSQEIKEVNKILNSCFLTTGHKVDEFEEKFSKYIGTNYTIGLTSCTAALQLILGAYGINHGDEVITTPMSFVASSNAIIQARAIPVFVDVEKETGNINTDLIEKAITKRTKAILVVHLYGQMCDMKRLKKIANKHSLRLIEDAAHCLEGKRDNIRPGQISDAACFSFYATKSITCGEGGAVATNDKKLAKKLKKMRLHGLTKSAIERYDKKFEHWDMKDFGWKYNMDNIQAALLVPQLKNIEKNWQKRNTISKKYEKALDVYSSITYPTVLPKTKHARHLFTFWVDSKKRDKLAERIQQKGIGVTINYRPVHLLKYYRKHFGYKSGMFPQAESIGKRTISLPLYSKLKNKEISYIINCLKTI